MRREIPLPVWLRIVPDGVARETVFGMVCGVPMPPDLSLSLEQRIAGVLIPVFALRSARDQGIGDTGSLRQFIRWAADTGFALVQLLPINETGGDNSPYNAISSMALDPVTLDLTPEALPDVTPEDHAAALSEVDLTSLRDGPVQYAKVKPLKQRLLRRAFERFNAQASSERRAAFDRFRVTNAGWLDDYTLFRALMERHGNTECWDRWPEGQRDIAAGRQWSEELPEPGRKAFDLERQFYAYVQWIAYGQWEDLKKFAGQLGVALMGDIPLGVSYYSADYFGNPRLFETGWSGGAPPEPYFKDDAFTQKWGQNWGIPVYDWAEMRKDDNAWWRQRVGGVRDLFHVFRIDHILGFYRIYSFPWRPERNAEFLPLSPDEARAHTGGRQPGFYPRADDTPEDRAANCRDGEALLRIVLEAAGDTRLIGEDLGTVPEYVRPNLTKLGIAGFKIPIWEPDHQTGGLLPGEGYARLSLATYGTHDHEPLRALWNRWHADGREGHHELHRLSHFAGLPHVHPPPAFDESLHERLLEALFCTNSWIAVCMITDLLAREERFNVPGTATDSNWSQRMHLTVESLATDPEHQRRAKALRAMLEKAGRQVPATA